MKLWEGRFSKSSSQELNDFNSSIKFDSRMYKQDIIGSIAHSKMLGKIGILSDNETDLITSELQRILSEIETGTLPIDMSQEDIHTFIEATLTERIGDTGKKLHTARSRNDQVAVDIRLYIKDEIDQIEVLLNDMITVIVNKADNHKETIMPGYTHLQRAQPITFAHHLLAYANMFIRDIKRLENTKKNMDFCPLGAGALAGTTYEIDRFMTAELLGFSAPTENSLDSVSDRDFCIELLSTLSIIAMHLSRFSEEIIFWCSWECKFIELDDAFSTGSSIMPQKKNPDIAELVRGKAGRIYGDLNALLTIMKGLSLAYNKDMQEDKEATFDAIDTIKMCLSAFTPMIDTMNVLESNMRTAAAKGFINATDCADYLVKNGMPFREAYKITGKLVFRCIELETTLENLSLLEYKKHSDIFSDDIYKFIDLNKCLNDRLSYGGPSPKSVEIQINNIRKNLNT